MGLSTQHCINCIGIQSSLLFRVGLGKSKFCCSAGERTATGHPAAGMGDLEKGVELELLPLLLHLPWPLCHQQYQQQQI